MPSTRSTKNKTDVFVDDSVSDIENRMEQMAVQFQKEMEGFKTKLARAQDPEKDAACASEADSGPSIDELSNSFSDFEKRVNKELNALQVQVHMLNKSLNQVKLIVDNNLQWSYRNRILMYGIPEDNSQTITSLMKLAVGLINEKISDKGVELQIADIADCYRYGRSKPNMHRPVLIEFMRPFVRNRVFTNKSAFKGSDIVLSEYLTKTRHAIFREARRRYRKDSWTMNGNIFVKTNNGEKKRIDDISELS